MAVREIAGVWSPTVAGDQVGGQSGDVILFISRLVAHGRRRPNGRAFADRSPGGGFTPRRGVSLRGRPLPRRPLAG